MQIRCLPSLLNSQPARLAAFASLLALLAAFIPGTRYIQSSSVFLPLHTAIEIISVIIGSAIFALVWESRTHRSKGTLLLACGFLATSCLDLAHLLSYAGMPDFITPSSTQKAINFWLAARLTVAISLFVFALRSTDPRVASNSRCRWQFIGAIGYSAIVCWILLAFPESIPSTFIPGLGLTSFKIGVEWLVIAINVVAAIFLLRRHLAHHHPFDQWLAAAAWMMALAEIFFTVYATVTDLYNLLGHLYKIAAYLLAYRALVTNIVRQPYEKLAYEADRNRTILETAQDGIHLVNMQGKVIDANRAFAEMLGYTAQEIRQLHVSDFEGVKSPVEVAELIEQLRQGESSALFETQLRRKDGKLIDAEVAISLAQLSGEEFLVVAARNIADRKASDSLRLAGKVFKNAHVGLLITDTQGNIVEINPTACEITGYEHEELIGKNPSLLKSGQHPEIFYKDMWASLLAEGFWSSEICNRRKSGELYHELLSITVIRDRHDQPINYLAVFSDITRRKLAEDKMRQIAHFDALTGLPNRLLLADRLDQAIAQSQRNKKILAICFMDLDGFKLINDSLGHEAGDDLLKEVGTRLQSLLRGSDTVARLGGDEFVMLISDLGSEDECILALQRILQSVATPYVLVGNTLSEISVSIGVTLYPADSSDPDTLLRHADHAMYAAKQAGKNCFQLFDARMEQRLQARQETLRRVARGLTAGQFQLHYQPKVDCRSNQVIGVEALIRWNHPILGKLTPNEFLPLLEDDDLALSLGEWVFREALRQGRLWVAEGIALCISVNAFPRQLQRPNFPDVVAQAIADLWPDLPPGKFMIEITETAALRELDSIQKTIQACREFGIAFSLDDFGTGYSSLSYLRQLTVDELKIDQSFVRDMLVDTEDMSIINGLIGLGRAFDLKVVAEGVETEAHINSLLEQGCHIMQGYGIARPMPAEKLGPWLKEFSEHPTWSTQ
jgi:diguanylate cyclase (GGDEF)-like protein/PAS domain S-box-containing protein